MSRAARSIQIWSIYLLVLGAGLAVIPNLILSTLGVTETNEVWIRILGVVVVLLAFYYWDAARYETINFFVASVMGRLFAVASLVVFWAMGAPWQLLLFAALEAGGALWTLSALRVDAEESAGN